MNQKCKKLVVKGYYPDGKPLIIFGIVVEDSQDCFVFRTARKDYTITKQSYFMLSETPMDFEGVCDNENS